MAIPATDNTAPLFITQQPAWELRVSLEQMQTTDIQISRSGLEQRQGRRLRCMFKLSYRAILDSAQRKARETRAAAEIRSLCYVPIWTEEGVTASNIVADICTMDRRWSEDFFAPGDWMLFDDGTQQQFREILAIGANSDQELELVPLGGGINFTAGTKIWPVRAAIRDSGQSEFEQQSEATYVERLNFQTL